MPVRNINERYLEETYDEKGLLSTYRVKYPEDYNFGYDIVDDIAVNDPDRRALVWDSCNGGGRTFTFAEMKRMSDKTANCLAAHGIGKGDVVMLILKQRYQFWFCMVALHKLGAIAAPATHMLTKHDIEYRVRAADVKAVICTDQSNVSHSVEAAEDIPSLKVRILCGENREGWLDFDAEVEAAPEGFERRDLKAEEPMLMYFTSGTSGNPKMVLHDHTYSLGHILTAKHWHQVDPEGIHYTVSDTGWGKAVWGALYGQWIMEAAAFVYEYEKFVPSDILDLIEKHRITTFCCPPTMFRLYLNAGLEGHDLSSLQNCCIAGEALNPDTFNTWYQATGLKLMEGFGQTETTLAISTLRGMEPKPGSMGKPSPQFEVDIVNEDGESCPPGVNGEIVVKADAPGIMIGYYRDPEKTAVTLRGGWHHTGDVAWKDEDGYYWFVGRNDDIIKSSGYRISPFEIESALMLHPAVLECAVTGVPDPVRGQLVKATIVLRQGFEPSDDLKREIQEFTKRETAPYKYPRVVDFVPELPKTISGKVRRVEIRGKDAEASKKAE
ncbi:MAG: AMP-binding protein [Candidatus Methanomethylophilaceae archaeon]|nr:AMP-binding protein [Candidatus Methanomethylophilaceae archaeon]